MLTKNHRLQFIALLLVLILGAITTPLCQTPSTDEYDVIKVDTNLVSLNVSVTSKNDRPITGLVANNFQILDDGVEIKPEYFDTQGPASIVFVIDTSTSMRGEKWNNLRQGLKEFLKKQKEADYTLITFNECPELITQSTNAETLWTTLNKIRPDGETAIYDGLLLALNQATSTARRHTAIILISDGADNRSTATLSDIEQRVLSTHATIYAVGILLDKRQAPQDQWRGQELLVNLASTTGGLNFFPTPLKIEKTLNEITAEITHQYSFGYYPLSKTQGVRTIEVNLLKSNLRRTTKLRYQSKYIYK
jgi:VWFA-related protein